MPKKTVKKTVKKTAKKPTKKVTAVQPTAVVTPPVVPTAPVKTEAEKIWESIKDLPIQMFALPGQTIEQHCTPVAVEPSKLYVVIRSTATLPSLEAAIAPAFKVELADRFVIISRVPPVLAPSKKK